MEAWHWHKGEHWLLSGDNESGADLLAERIPGRSTRNDEAGDAAIFVQKDRIWLASFAEAARLMAWERSHDDSDFTEGGVDPGRTAYRILAERTGLSGESLQGNPTVIACGVNRFGDRGIKYLSTGEIRRLLLCEALVSQVELLVLEDPYDGVDTEGRKTITALLEAYMKGPGALLLVMERPTVLPRGLTHALFMENHAVSFRGTLDGYRAFRSDTTGQTATGQAALREAITGELDLFASKGCSAARNVNDGPNTTGSETPLVEMNNVTVEWSGRKVLDSLNWKLVPGSHWLIRGPNGSGKTTFLELITGDNPQVFRNDVWLFGKKRGSGETIWEIKERMGIVSYKIHLEFRMVGDQDAESVILSGFHDSIGLYRQKGEEETLKARSWLELGGFAGREADRFSELSYGEQRAILILRAVVKSPQILILDEPCHGLDERHRELVLELLEAIGASGRTTLLHVTHDPTEALECERNILELRPGETPMYTVVTR